MPIPDPVPFLLVLARLGGLVLAAPVFGHALVPVRVRAALAGVLAVVLTPAITPAHPLPTTLWGLAGAAAVETALGALIGFVAQLVFAGVALGGQLAGIQMGFGLANLVDPSTHAQVTIIAEWEQFVALVVFLVLDVHHLLLQAVLASFRVAPPGGVVLAGAGLQTVFDIAGDVFGVGVRIAAPVLIVLLMTNAALGVLARTIPQLNVFVVGFSVNVGVGLVVLGASLPFTVRLLAGRFGGLEPALDQLVRGLVRG
jgi:flagellar biosynthetic protein FliR